MKYKTIKMKALDIESRKMLIEKYLTSFGKNLPTPQIERIAHDQETENTLALRTLLDELRMFGIHEKLDGEIDKYLGAGSIPELFTLVLDRREKTFNYGTGNFVKEVLSLLYVAKQGLSEEEIRAFTGAAPLYWSQLFNGIASHLSVRAGMITLSHKFIRDAVKSRYLPDNTAANKYRLKLAESMNDPDSIVSPRRKYDEIAHQLFECADWDALYRLLLDFKILGYLDINELERYWRTLLRTDRKKYAIEKYCELDTQGRSPAKMSKLFQTLCALAGELVNPSLFAWLGTSMISKLVRATALAGEVEDPSMVVMFADKIIQLDPNNAAAYITCGNVYRCYNANYNQAIANYNKALQIDANNADAYYNRGLAYNGKKDYARAITDFSEIIRLVPNYAATYFYRGNAYNGKKDFDHAIADFNEAIRLNPNFDMAYNNRGVSYDRKGDYDQAIADYTKALLINPNNAPAKGNAAAAQRSKDIFGKNFTKMFYSIIELLTGLFIIAGVNYIADRIDYSWMYFFAIIINIVGIVWFFKTIIIGVLKHIRPKFFLVVFGVLRIITVPLDIGLSVYFIKGRETGNPVSVVLQNPFKAVRNFFDETKTGTDMKAEIFPPVPSGAINTKE